MLCVCEIKGNDRADRLAENACNHHKWLASRKIINTEELQRLPADTKLRQSHHRSPGGERCGKRRRSTIFRKRKRKSNRQSNKHWNSFKSNVEETYERRNGAHVDFSERTDTNFS